MNIKVVVVGSGKVGKTSLLLSSFNTNRFRSEYVPTVYDNYSVSLISAVHGHVNLGLWDTAGYDDFKQLRPLSYSKTDIVLLCYSTVNRESFEDITDKWIPEIRQHIPNAHIILVGTKTDLRNECENPVSTEEGQLMAVEIGAHAFHECSARNLQNISSLFSDTVITIHGLIVNNKLPAEHARSLNEAQINRLTHSFINKLIIQNQLTVEQILALDDQKFNVLTNMEQTILCGHLTVEQVLQFNEFQLQVLSHKNITRLIENNRLTIDQALQLTELQFQVLKNEVINRLIVNNPSIVEQVLNQFNEFQFQVLTNWHITQLIENNRLTIAQALNLNDFQFQVLTNWNITQLIENNRLTIAQALNLNDFQFQVLTNWYITLLIENNRLTIAQALVLNQQQFDNLRGVGDRAPAHPVINPGQSTHTASVHRSASESATRLWDFYKEKIDVDAVILGLMIYFSNDLENPDNSEQIEAAKRCILRICADGFHFTDPCSGVTSRQVLAAIFFAINNPDPHSPLLASQPDAMQALIRGLYEIQREYNLSENGTDMGGPDHPACTAGHFNKLIAAMQGVLPQCTIEYVTTNTARLKLPVIVVEEMMKYLSQLDRYNVENVLHLTKTIDDMHTNPGIPDDIWQKIRNTVSERMFTEFGSLFPEGRESANFVEFIDAGQYTNLENYRDYMRFCNSMLGERPQQSSSFFQAYVDGHRHENPAMQNLYDKSFGLSVVQTSGTA